MSNARTKIHQEGQHQSEEEAMATRRRLDAESGQDEGRGDQGGERRPARPPEPKKELTQQAELDRQNAAVLQTAMGTAAQPTVYAPEEPPLTAEELRKLRRHMRLWP